MPTEDLDLSGRLAKGNVILVAKPTECMLELVIRSSVTYSLGAFQREAAGLRDLRGEFYLRRLLVSGMLVL